MITKGIIKSIDFLGNTCTVHIPFFETAGNDPIIETATVSNTPGSYNGYKIGDVVYVAFEDGSMSTPVIIGKLYLGTEKEKSDPRGVVNVEESTTTKKASLPADSALTAEFEETTPNTTVPYTSLASIANGLNTLNTEVGQMDRDYGNRIMSIISNADGQSTLFTQTVTELRTSVNDLQSDTTTSLAAINTRIDGANTDIANANTLIRGVSSELTQTAAEIRAEIAATAQGGVEASNTAITQTANEIKSEVATIQANLESSISQNTSAIQQNANTINARVDTKLDSRSQGSAESTEITSGLTSKGLGWGLDNTKWVVKAYDQNTGNTLPEAGLDLFKITRDTIEINAPNVRLAGYPRVTTVRYAYGTDTVHPSLYKNEQNKSVDNDAINLKTTGDGGWTTTELPYKAGSTVWQWTQTAKYEYSTNINTWTDSITDTVVKLAINENLATVN